MEFSDGYCRKSVLLLQINEIFMAKFYPLPVVHKKYETADAITIGFMIPDQYKSEFNYIQGQYLTLRMNINGEEVRRSYSLCTSPLEDEILSVTIKRVAGGKMSNALNDGIQLGTVIEVMPPDGRFYSEMNASHQKQYILIGGGSGITPLFSIIRTVLKAEPNSNITLIYGNRDEKSIIFKADLDSLVAKHGNRLKVIYALDNAPSGWNGIAGMLSKDTIATLVKESHNQLSEKEYFICGPEGLMKQAQEALETLQINKEKVHIEFFTTPTSSSAQNETVGTTATDDSFDGTAEVTVVLDGKEHVLTINDNTTVLRAAIKAKIDPPFSCEAGICSSCIAKVVEGAVRMDENNILSESELEEGFILTCQSHPTTKKVKLKFLE